MVISEYRFLDREWHHVTEEGIKTKDVFSASRKLIGIEDMQQGQNPNPNLKQNQGNRIQSKSGLTPLNVIQLTCRSICETHQLGRIVICAP
jgi:hypothetical protein